MPTNLQFSRFYKKSSRPKPNIVIGIIKETKTPPDSRVPLSPEQCRKIEESYPFVHFVIESSSHRCYSDQEYRDNGIEVQDGPMSHCDVLMGVKEVDLNTLIPNKTYLFFSHTIKKQPYNRKLLQAILRNNIRLIDYECLVSELSKKRVIAFGHWAGIVGAHNTILAYGKKTGEFELPRLYKCRDFDEGKQAYKDISFKGIRVALTGTGRVSNGSAKLLDSMGFKKISAEEFLDASDDAGPVYVQLRTCEIFGKQSDGSFDRSFYECPETFRSLMRPFLARANVLINGIFWDFRAPALFDRVEMLSDDFKIRVIGDITCDIAPEASIPCTLRPTVIADPVFGYDPATHSETLPYLPHNVDMMTVDNLPNELPRDASADFGGQFMNSVMASLFDLDFRKDSMLDRASITVAGELNSHFEYLRDYVES